ncbi:endolytic transglycosylase MltG [Pseudoalteromonas fenneropenaei]|uniref:Endolytic murein transglycosylase n=1 Tax=Pseudoalteromonas fenneropenaei TaxID=1737459 RepID=A0ABV7CF21_9GAMM
MNKIRFFVLLLIGALILAGVAVKNWQNTVTNATLSLGTATLYEVKAGQGAVATCRDWQQRGWVNSCWPFQMLFKLQPELGQLQKGLYELQGETVTTTFRRLARGEQKQFSFTIIEGETLKQVISKLQTTPYLDFDLDDVQLTQLFSASGSGEGWLLPETYHYTAASKASAMVKRAYQNMQNTLNTAWQARHPELPLNSPYEALILASIIEKETAIAAERTLVASVFINRLNKKMRLQTDPTVIYGLGEAYQGDITRAHLNQHTPYNTYKISGLPPTPIAMPSKAAVYAAVQPASSEFLYFVADGNGGHTFSTNLNAHNQAVQEYLKKSKNAG